MRHQQQQQQQQQQQPTSQHPQPQLKATAYGVEMGSNWTGDGRQE